MTVRGRRRAEDAMLLPRGLSACRVRAGDPSAARDRVTVSFTLACTHERTGKDPS
jgi:hypothetical protein